MKNSKELLQTKVQLSRGLYFIISEESFDLCYKDDKLKNPKVMGYYTSLESLIKRATQFIISKDNVSYDITAFLNRWNSIQSEMASYVSKYKF
jgi:hypothetical protein